MNPAPLPQPTPHTCLNCGAAMQSKLGFCPYCGARQHAAPQARVSPLVTVLWGLGLFVFGGIGACGAVATLSAVQSGPYQAMMLVFSLPSLLLGAVGFIACLRPFLKRK